MPRRHRHPVWRANLNAILRHARRLTQAQLRAFGVLGRRHAPGSKIWIYRLPDGDYLISLKDNQPTLLALVEKQLVGSPLLPTPREAATAP